MTCRSLTCGIGVAILACAAAPAALAAGPPPPAIAQYVETAPSAGGATVTGYGKTHVRKLPKPIVKQIEQHAPPAAAAALKTVATSSQYGAPQSTLHLAPKHVARKHVATKHHVYVKHRPEQRAAASGAGAASAVPATATLTSGSGDSSIAGLAIVLVLVTAAMATVGIRNR